MFTRRTAASLTGLIVLAGSLSVIGTAQAAPQVRAASVQQPAAGMRAAVAGQPPRNYVIPAGTLFSFPNKGSGSKLAIRNRVLYTIQSVWGGPRDSHGLPLSTNGTIRLATWSFNDMAVAKALYAAHLRGVSVQIMAAASANRQYKPWQWLKKRLGGAFYRNGVAGSSDKVSFARECRGACRGRGGTPHSKYFLFDNVGSGHARHVVVQSSMNLTKFAYQGQWNQALTLVSQPLYNDFLAVFRETRLNRPQASPYRRYVTGSTTSMFFPRPSTSPAGDPVMQALNRTRCTGSTAGGNGRTKIRIIQYAIYDNRGVWLSKKLRSLWQAGCDVAILYTVATRPVLDILRNHSGRGAIPMRQSVITNGKHEITKYNHSKWMTIAGNWGSSTAAFVTFAGSANWSNAAFSNDEQMQQVPGYSIARAHNANFNQTWVQRSSHTPGYGKKPQDARMVPASNSVPWGKGAFKYLTPEG